MEFSVVIISETSSYWVQSANEPKKIPRCNCRYTTTNSIHMYIIFGLG